MASLPTTKIIVKNLPDSWTDDFLLNYLEVTSGERLIVASEGIQVFPGVTHSALITLEEPVTAETVRHVQGLLDRTPFQKTNVLALQMLSSQTCSLLVHYLDPRVSRDHIQNYFEVPELSGCGDGYVKDCKPCEELLLAVVIFSSAEALEGVITKGNHRLTNGGEVVKVEPWYEPFHRPLLQQLTGQRRTCQTQIEARGYRRPQVHEDQIKPTYQMPAERHPSTPSASHFLETNKSRESPISQCVNSATAPNISSGAGAREKDKLKRENEQLRRQLAAKEREEREQQRQQMLRQEEEQRRKERFLVEQEAEKHQMEMFQMMEERQRMERETFQKAMEEKHAETEKLERRQGEMLQFQQMENKQLKSENEKLKNQTSIRLPVPSYKFRLLENLEEQCTACKAIFLEDKGELMLCGTEEGCRDESLRVLQRLQGLADDVVDLPEPVAQILDSPQGRSYLTDLVKRHWGCSAELQGLHIMCAALTVEELEDFKKELDTNILRKTCQVPATLTKSFQFQALKTKLEKDYMVMLTCSVGESEEDVHLDGLKGDVELAVREVIQFTNLNRSGSKKFVISGALQSTACCNWFSAELDEVKLLILRNNGEIEAETKDGEYVLTFQCRQEILEEVITKLEAIKSSIVSETIDLNEEFPESFERPLLINGLYDMGAGHFCSQLAGKVKETGVQSMGDIKLPEKCPLPPFNLPRGKDRHRDRSRSRERSSKRSHRHRKPPSSGDKRRGSGRGSAAARRVKKPSGLPASVSVGGTHISVKLGDITSEEVAAAVSVVGPDLNPKLSAVGATFLNKWPALSSKLAENSGSNGGGAGDRCRVVTTQVTHGARSSHPLFHEARSLHAFLGLAQSPLPMSTLFHAVLSKLQKPDVSKTVKNLVMEILQMAVQKQLTSIAFPPLGVGRRFGFGRYTTACAMMSACQEFLQANPGAMENITVVVYNDASLADKFVEAMEQTFRWKRSKTTSASPDRSMVSSDAEGVPSESADSGTSETEDEEEQEAEDKFEAVVCAKSRDDCQTVKEMLLKELRHIFLWQETLRDSRAQAFLALPFQQLQELSDSAMERNVLMSKRWHGEGVRLCGQQDKVREMLLLILGQIDTGRTASSQQDRAKRHRLRLPEDTHRLPSYWRIYRGNQMVTYDKAIESWKARGFRFNFISEEEQNTVRQLVTSTWELAKVGQGADAKNLKHSNIQVRKVMRLENPMLWQKYSHKREQLFTNLIFNHQGRGPAACTPVESLPNSKGPVHTTQRIAERGPLGRFIFQQINEHYLFHGTKKDILKKICSEGLDNRMTGKAMLGQGVYLTESPTKADQYADAKDSRLPQGQELNILLVRVLLGEPYLHAGNPENFVRPPCYLCKKKAHDCSCPHPRTCDSLVFDSNKIFREFVVYDRDACYPEYIITYTRV